jgi:SAM-dependent methyltransferase
LAWYRFAAGFAAGKTVLDAGCGLGLGLCVLQKKALHAEGQDLDPRLARPGIHIGGLDSIPSKSFDLVVSIDVVEHVEDDRDFIMELGRIARKQVFVTTPNWTVTRCSWPYHLREYTPRELTNLLSPIGRVRLFKGNGPGTMIFPVRYRAAYFALNDARNFALTGSATRYFSRLALPLSARLHSHNAALVEIA